MDDVYTDRDRALTLLQLQQTLIEELTAETVRLRAERDELQRITARLDLVLDRLKLFERI